MSHGKDNLWMLLADMWPLLMMLATTALVGWIMLRTTATERKQLREGRFGPLYQAFLIILLAFYVFRIAQIVLH